VPCGGKWEEKIEENISNGALSNDRRLIASQNRIKIRANLAGCRNGVHPSAVQ